MGKPLLLTRSDLPDDKSVNNQLGPSTTTPITAEKFDLKSSECVVGIIMRIPSSVQQNNFSLSQLVAANRTIHCLHN